MTRLCALAELPVGEVTKHSIGRTSFLVFRSAESVSIFSHTCPHDGADLSGGIVCDGEIVCPSHFSRFDIRTGKPVAPALDAITVYEADVVDGIVYVGRPRSPEQGPSPEETSVESDRNTNDERRSNQRDDESPGRKPSSRVIIIGAGAAGLACAEGLRQHGFAGTVTMITSESEHPYDRTRLSKSFLLEETETPPLLRDPLYLESIGIELLRSVRIVGIDPENKTITSSDGEVFNYDTLVVATGAGASDGLIGREVIDSSEQIHSIRSYADARRFQHAVRRSQRLTVIGAGFVALEVAASAAAMAVEVTVVCAERLPFEPRVGEEVARAIVDHHRRSGITFLPESFVAGVDGGSGSFALEGGEEIEFECLLVATGARLDTELFVGSGLRLDDGLVVDGSLRSSDPSIFAAGDIAAVELPGRARNRFEHWIQAERQGSSIAREIAGVGEVYRDLPCFWSTQGSVTVKAVGWTSGGTEQRVARSGDEIICGFFDSGSLKGAAAIGYESALLGIECALRAREKVDSNAFDVRVGR